MPKGIKGSGEPKVSTEYWIAQDEPGSPFQIGGEVIPKFHTDIASAKVCYLFRSKAGKNGSKVTLATASKVSGRLKALVGYDFIVEVAYDEWQNLNDMQRHALIDHELCHCGGEEDEQTGDMKWFLAPHDLEEFTDIVKRYGLWKSDIQAFADAFPKAAVPVAPVVVPAAKVKTSKPKPVTVVGDIKSVSVSGTAVGQ